MFSLGCVRSSIIWGVQGGLGKLFLLYILGGGGEGKFMSDLLLCGMFYD
jgi:hypothetical protein